MKRKMIIMAMLVITFASGIVVYATWQRVFSNIRKTPVATILLHHGGTPMVIVACVSDANGQAVKGAELDFRNNSGGNVCTTDATGRACVSVNETDLEEITINGTSMVKWPHTYLFGHPSVAEGLFVNIIIQDPKLMKNTKSFQPFSARGSPGHSGFEQPS